MSPTVSTNLALSLQFLTDVKWGELDFMIIDLPPGTGDAQLTLTQKAGLTRDAACAPLLPGDDELRPFGRRPVLAGVVADSAGGRLGLEPRPPA